MQKVLFIRSDSVIVCAVMKKTNDLPNTIYNAIIILALSAAVVLFCVAVLNS
tara:strand:+ start:333 stop:488 length:156 start_codon:yes stop_codon:yes gene_type:complete